MRHETRFLIAVLVIVQRDEKILLVQQDYGERYWSLPGGLVEHGESLEAAAVREVREETGLNVKILRLIGLYSKPAENALAITFEGLIVGGILRPANEITQAGFFPPDDLPQPVRAHLTQRLDDYLANQPAAFVRTQ
jgi:ADP-ribose pyrophosphatase YjhB (NUDIX family)